MRLRRSAEEDLPDLHEAADPALCCPINNNNMLIHVRNPPPPKPDTHFFFEKKKGKPSRHWTLKYVASIGTHNTVSDFDFPEISVLGSRAFRRLDIAILYASLLFEPYHLINVGQDA